ncbi:MAG: TRAP transporter permease, partial [Pseudomonadota bacterium]
GELSPPTSLTAAISARIAEASFMHTMWEALRICLPITLMTFAIFSRSEMVVTPGWTQIGSIVVVTIGTCGTALAMFGRLLKNPAADILLRAVLMFVAFVALFYPDDKVSAAVAAFVLAATIFGVMRHRRIAPRGLQSQPAS